MNWLDVWKEQKIKSIQLRMQSELAEAEATYAEKMHSAANYGKAGNTIPGPQAGATQHMAAPATQQPPPQNYQQPAAQQPQGQPAGNGNGHSGIFCADCGAELKDKAGRDGGAPWTAAKAAKHSIDQCGRVLCYPCSRKA